jgi:predicted PurR-regulated permease PerM
MSTSEPTASTTGGLAPERPTRRLQAPTPRVGLVIAAAAVLLFVALDAREALTPFLVGLVVAYLLAPAVDRLSHARVGARRLGRGLAILLTYLIVVLASIVAAAVLVPPLARQLQEFAAGLPELLDALGAWYATLELPEWLRTLTDRIVASAQDAGSTAAGLDLGSLLPVARSLAGTVAAVFGYLIVPVWVFYLVKDLPSIREAMERALPRAWRRDAKAVVAIVDHTFGRWIRGQLLLGLVVGAATFVGLLLLGQAIDPVFTSFSVLLAVLAGVLELVPVIGPILSMIPTLLLALTTGDPIKAALAVVALYLVVQQLENNILVPKIQGDAVELHPSVVLVVLLVGGAIAGFLGAVLAVPVTAAGRDIYRYLFRRLSEDDPDVPDADAPDLARKTGRGPVEVPRPPAGPTAAAGGSVDATAPAPDPRPSPPPTIG